MTSFKKEGYEMYKKILTPLDGSTRAEQILPHVQELAVRYEATVILLRVIDPAADLSTASLVASLADDLEPPKKKAEAYLNGIKERLQKDKIDSQTMVITGIPLEAICQTAEKEKADIIALASHGRTGAARLFYGSVAAGVLHRIDRPLLLIRSEKD